MPKQTVLHEMHQALGASFTDFGGWDMPVRYTSDLVEHAAVREAAGIFDISHMAEIFVHGADAAAFLDHALVGLSSEIAVGRAKYSMICNPTGGIIDDLIVYRLAEDQFLIIANAGNRHPVVKALSERHNGFAVKLRDESDEWALIAVQGPKAAAILQRLSSSELGQLKYYSIAESTIAGAELFMCRTGYTGEDGFELLVRNDFAEQVFEAVLVEGKGDGLIPCGLAARDTLRLEAGMPLYGHELTEQVTPYEAGLGRVVRLTGRGFVGEDSLTPLSITPKRTLVGLRGEGKRAARAEYPVIDPESGQTIGLVTSGALSPTLGYPVAMALIDSGKKQVGDAVIVDVRGTHQDFQIVNLPFYKKAQ